MPENLFKDTFNQLKDNYSQMNEALASSQFQPEGSTTKKKRDFSQFAGTEIPFTQDPSQVISFPNMSVANDIGFSELTKDTSTNIEDLKQSPVVAQAPAQTTTTGAQKAVVDSAQVPAVSPSAETVTITKATPQAAPVVNAPATPATDAINARIEKAMGLLPGTLGQGQALLDEEKKRGVEELQGKLASKRGEIAQKTAQYNAQIQGLEGQGRGIPMSIVRGQQGAVARQAASEIGILQAEELSLVGQVDAAKDAAKNAVDLIYADRIQEINNLMTSIELLKPLADKEETRRLEARADALTAEQRKIDADKFNRENTINLSLNALTNGAPDEIIKAMQDADSPEEAIRLGGSYIDRNERTLTELQIANQRADLNMKYSDMAREAARIKAIEDMNGDLSFSMLTPEQQDLTLKLRKEYGAEDQTKDFVQQKSAYQRILASAEDPSAAGDLALIFNYMKVLDPGSTVREGEFANAQNAGGVGDKIRARYNSVINGKRLSEAQRTDFVSTAERLFSKAQLEQKVINDDYESLASSAGIPSTFIVRDTNIAVDEEKQTLDSIRNSVTGTAANSTDLLNNFVSKN